jgi:hypothetical protein
MVPGISLRHINPISGKAYTPAGPIGRAYTPGEPIIIPHCNKKAALSRKRNPEAKSYMADEKSLMKGR